jgi:hypothetical protein
MACAYEAAMRPDHGIMGLPGYQGGALIRRLVKEAAKAAKRAALAKKLSKERRITGPAIRIKVDGEDVIISSPQGRSHQQVMKKHPEVPNTPIGEYDDEFIDMEIFDRISEMKKEGVRHSDIFGFVDQNGTFLVPSEAAAVAYDTGQLKGIAALRRSDPVEKGLSGSRYREFGGQNRYFHDLHSEDLLGIAGLLAAKGVSDGWRAPMGLP